MVSETEIACQIVDKNYSSGDYGIPLMVMVYNISVDKNRLPKWINRIILTEAVDRGVLLKIEQLLESLFYQVWLPATLLKKRL